MKLTSPAPTKEALEIDDSGCDGELLEEVEIDDSGSDDELLEEVEIVHSAGCDGELLEEVKQLRGKLEKLEEDREVEREELAKCYILECEKTERLEETLHQRELFTHALIGRLRESEKECEELKRKIEAPKTEENRYKEEQVNLKKSLPNISNDAEK